MLQRNPYAYRDDPSVPSFPDDAPIVVYDGACGLCSRWVIFLLRRSDAVRFIAAQSQTGQALFRHFGVDPEDYETWLYLDEGLAYEKLTAVAKALAPLGGVWTVLAWLFARFPKRLGDWLYDRVARNRYTLFGQSGVPFTPKPEHLARFIAVD